MSHLLLLLHKLFTVEILHKTSPRVYCLPTTRVDHFWRSTDIINNFNFTLCYSFFYDFSHTMLINRQLDTLLVRKRLKAPSLTWEFYSCLFCIVDLLVNVCSSQKVCCFGLIGACIGGKFCFLLFSFWILRLNV